MRLLRQTHVQLFLLALVIAFYLFYRFFTLFELPKEEILADTHARFERETFLDWASEHLYEIDTLMSYLVAHSDSVWAANRIDQYNGSAHKANDCQRIQIQTNESHMLALKVGKHTFRTFPNFNDGDFEMISVCRQTENRDAQAIMRLRLPSSNEKYVYVRHELTSMATKPDVLRITSLDDCLRKRKYLGSNISYVIEVYPYNGW